MTRQMCLYTVEEAPYLAVSEVKKVTNEHYYIEDIKGNTKKVRPLYVGPFDAETVLLFGALVSKYIAGVHDLQCEVNSKTCELFRNACARA